MEISRDYFESITSQMNQYQLTEMINKCIEIVLNDKDCRIGRLGISDYPKTGLQILPMWRNALIIREYQNSTEKSIGRIDLNEFCNSYVWYFKRDKNKSIIRRKKLIDLAEKIIK